MLEMQFHAEVQRDAAEMQRLQEETAALLREMDLGFPAETSGEAPFVRPGAVQTSPAGDDLEAPAEDTAGILRALEARAEARLQRAEARTQRPQTPRAKQPRVGGDAAEAQQTQEDAAEQKQREAAEEKQRRRTERRQERAGKDERVQKERARGKGEAQEKQRLQAARQKLRQRQQRQWYAEYCRGKCNNETGTKEQGRLMLENAQLQQQAHAGALATYAQALQEQERRQTVLQVVAAAPHGEAERRRRSSFVEMDEARRRRTRRRRGAEVLAEGAATQEDREDPRWRATEPGAAETLQNIADHLPPQYWRLQAAAARARLARTEERRQADERVTAQVEGEGQPQLDDAETVFGDTETVLDDAETVLGDAETARDEAGTVMGDAGTVLGDAGTELDEEETVMGDAGLVLGDAETEFGDAESEAHWYAEASDQARAEVLSMDLTQSSLPCSAEGSQCEEDAEDAAGAEAPQTQAAKRGHWQEEFERRLYARGLEVRDAETTQDGVFRFPLSPPSLISPRTTDRAPPPLSLPGILFLPPSGSMCN